MAEKICVPMQAIRNLLTKIRSLIPPILDLILRNIKILVAEKVGKITTTSERRSTVPKIHKGRTKVSKHRPLCHLFPLRSIRGAIRRLYASSAFSRRLMTPAYRHFLGKVEGRRYTFFPSLFFSLSLSLFLFLWSEIINSGCPSYRWHGSFIICYYAGSVGWNKSPYRVTDFILHPILAWCNCRRTEAANGRDSKSMGTKTRSMLRIFFHVSRITTFCWISYKMKNF